MKNYLIIGGSSGIGKSLVEILASNNDQVFSTYNNHPAENKTNIQYQYLNVLEGDLDLDSLPEEIHGLAYCPGNINLKPFHRFKEEDFIEDYKLQVLGATKIIRVLLPQLKKSGNSSIVLFSTIAVQNGFNFHTQVSMSKGAIEGLTRALSAELAPTIRVNAVAPALTNTPLAERLLSTPEKIALHSEKNPLKKVGEAEDIAKAAAYLLTNQSSWVTGQIIPVDGGYSTIKS